MSGRRLPTSPGSPALRSSSPILRWPGETRRTACASRVNHFDHGMPSKIQNSVTANLETVLKLAIGLPAPPEQILMLIGRRDLRELLTGTYSATFSLRRSC